VINWWLVAGYDGMNDSTDEVFMAAQEAGTRDAQGKHILA